MPKSKVPSDFHDLSIKNITGKNNRIGIHIKGLPEHKLREIKLENIRLTALETLECSDIETISMENVIIKCDSHR